MLAVFDEAGGFCRKARRPAGDFSRFLFCMSMRQMPARAQRGNSVEGQTMTIFLFQAKLCRSLSNCTERIGAFVGMNIEHEIGPSSFRYAGSRALPAR